MNIYYPVPKRANHSIPFLLAAAVLMTSLFLALQVARPMPVKIDPAPAPMIRQEVPRAVPVPTPSDSQQAASFIPIATPTPQSIQSHPAPQPLPTPPSVP